MRILKWIWAHLVFLQPEPSKQFDVEGTTVGFRWRFDWPFNKRRN